MVKKSTLCEVPKNQSDYFIQLANLYDSTP